VLGGSRSRAVHEKYAPNWQNGTRRTKIDTKSNLCRRKTRQPAPRKRLDKVDAQGK